MPKLVYTANNRAGDGSNEGVEHSYGSRSIDHEKYAKTCLYGE